jgi:PAS domain S-box-containing protein
MSIDARSANLEELAAEVERLAGIERELAGARQELAEYREEVDMQHSALLETQQALERSRDRYAALYDFAPIPYVMLDGFGTIRMVSLVGTQLLGKPRAQLVGLALLYLVAREDRPLFLEHMRRCRQGASEVRTELRRKPGLEDGRLKPGLQRLPCFAGTYGTAVAAGQTRGAFRTDSLFSPMIKCRFIQNAFSAAFLRLR